MGTDLDLQLVVGSYSTVCAAPATGDRCYPASVSNGVILAATGASQLASVSWGLHWLQ